MMPIITLLTDFGLRDSYVAEMKAVILSICPEACIIDICHEVKKFDIRMGAYLLARTSKYFPKGSIHVAVVDPGVGGTRRPIIVESERAFYVGPDNGLLMLSAEIDGIKHVYMISNERYMLKTVSRTFHGRDIFSPAAAYLARGIPPSEFGPEIHDPTKLSFTKPKISGNIIEGEVIHIDDFGNIITNISIKDLESINIGEGDLLNLETRNLKLKLKLCRSYTEVPHNTPLTIIGSSEFLEISINQGDAAKHFNIKTGDKILLGK
ncbi:MAG: S-adenosyl-l-methionine hydroxide adenosyltransferase family protein [Candidatus Methanomethylicia archaeon]